MTGAASAVLLLGDTLSLGGTEGQFVEIACRLDRARWDMRVACLRAEGPLRSRLETAGVRAWSCGSGSLKSPRFPLAVARLARDLRACRIRLVHCFDFYSNLLGVPAARLAGVPVTIASQRDLGDLRPRFQQRLHRLALRLADYVLVNSEAVAERVRGYRGVGRERVVVVPNGVDVTRFAPEERRGPRSGAPARVVIGTVSNLRPEKGLVDLVQAAALVRERCAAAHFVVWGEGPLRAELARLASALGLDGAFELRGRTVEPERALRELDIFVLPSLSEACSNVLLEAMATGLAVVATRVGGNPGLVEDEVSGLLVPPGDPVGLAKTIVRVVEYPELAVTLAARARARAHAEFTTDAMIRRIEALYGRALAGGGR